MWMLHKYRAIVRCLVNRNREKGRNVIVWCLFLLWSLEMVFVASIAADDPLAPSPEQLRQLEIRIRTLQSRMHDTQTEYGQRQQQLQQQEEAIGKIVERMQQLERERHDCQVNLDELEQQRAEQLQQLTAQRNVLAQQIRAAYLIGRQDYLKLWLNQESPDHIGRLLTYYDYFNRARANQIEAINDTLAQIQTLEKAIAQEKNRLNELINNLNHRKMALDTTQLERQRLLTDTLALISSQEAELKRLQEDKQRLSTLLGGLDSVIKQLPRPNTPPFHQLRGQLSLPVEGKIARQFGEARAGRLKWQGLLIAANLGEKVSAVAAGRVVFAEWFRNLGLLIILDHQHDYMTLYGYNQSIEVKVGDWVNAGDVIGRVGDSGGQPQSALYFEIRRQGEPIDPRPWLQP
jgi:murein hydrolase activator